jgi:hypothetical protein
MLGKVFSLDDARKGKHPAWPYLYATPMVVVSEKEAYDFLRGAVDMHAHGAPEAWLQERPSTLETCMKASELGMKAICFKDHNVNTSVSAWHLQEFLDRWATDKGITPIQVFGGVCLNYAVGGLNPRAVQVALAGDFGKRTKVIWGPSIDSAWQYKSMGKQGGITVLDENDRIKPEVKEIIKLIAGATHKTVLETCHLSVKEGLALADECKDANVDLVVTHASQELTVVTLEEAKELIRKGAWIQLAQCSILGSPLTDLGNIQNTDHAIRLIKELGPSRVILNSDAGQPGNPPVWAFMMLVRVLLGRGFSREELTVMTKENPSKVLGL